MTLAECAAHVGERVAYRSCPSCDEREFGVITSAGRRFAFVLYDGQAAAKATDPADLTLAGDGEPL